MSDGTTDRRHNAINHFVHSSSHVAKVKVTIHINYLWSLSGCKDSHEISDWHLFLNIFSNRVYITTVPLLKFHWIICNKLEQLKCAHTHTHTHTHTRTHAHKDKDQNKNIRMQRGLKQKLTSELFLLARTWSKKWRVLSTAFLARFLEEVLLVSASPRHWNQLGWNASCTLTNSSGSTWKCQLQ